MNHVLICMTIGIMAGFLSGIIGIGGGIIIVPALVLFLGLSQHTAQGTTLALMIPPIGILGVIAYYQHGYVDMKIAAWVALGVFLGVFLGAKTSFAIPELTLRKVFSVILMLVSIKMFFKR